MKKCLKCGAMISDNSGDYCATCTDHVKFTKEEKIINSISNIIMVLGIISSIVMAFTMIIVKEEKTFGQFSYTSREFNPLGLVITISTFVASIFFPIIIKLFVGISANIRHITNKNK